MAMLVTLVFPLIILTLTGISIGRGLWHLEHQQCGPARADPDSLRLHLMAGNNGSAFRRTERQHALVQQCGRFTMLIGRFFMIIPMLAIAGNLAKKKTVPLPREHFPVTTPLFSVLLVGVIVIVGALTFFPALSLGPILEHLLMMAGKTF
jgi:K+-transporting ATPase ATPase A chain